MRIEAKELKSVLQGMRKIVSNRSVLPVLGCVRMTGGSATVTDLDQSATYYFQSATGDLAPVCIPLAELERLVKGAPKGAHVDIDGSPKGGVDVLIQGVKATVACLPAEDFPTVPDEAGNLYPVPADEIKLAFGWASSEAGRYVLCSVAVECDGKGGNYVVATDGRRLLASNSWQSGLLGGTYLIKPSKFLAWLPGEWYLGAQVVRETGNRNLTIRAGAWTYIGREIEGNYPNWRQVVPDYESNGIRCTLTDEAAEGVLRACKSLPFSDKSYNVKLEFGTEALTLSSHVPEVGPASATVEGVSVPGKWVSPGSKPSICLNPDYLAAAIQAGARQVWLAPKSPELTPLLAYSRDGTRRMIVMPMRMS